MLVGPVFPIPSLLAPLCIQGSAPALNRLNDPNTTQAVSVRCSAHLWHLGSPFAWRLNLSMCRNGMHKGVQRVLRMRHYCISRDVMQRLETCATSNAPLLGGDTHVSSTLYRDHHQLQPLYRVHNQRSYCQNCCHCHFPSH